MSIPPGKWWARLKNLKLHNKILLALILGALFGAFLNVSKYKLEVVYREGPNEQTIIVERWQRIDFVTQSGEIMSSFGREDQLKLLGYLSGLGAAEKARLVIRVADAEGGDVTIQNIVTIRRVKTIAVQIRPIGTLFIRLLMFLAVPLVVASLIVGAASLGDIRRVGRIGGVTLSLYLVTTTVAITIGLIASNTLEPGKLLSPDSAEKLKVEFVGNVKQKLQQEPAIDIVETIVDIVPANPIRALASSEMIQIVFFALMMGVSLTLVGKEKGKPVIAFFDGFSETMIKMVDLIMKIAPFGVFALISATVAEFGFDILKTLIWYVAVVVLSLFLHMSIVYGSLVRFGAGLNPLRFYRAMRDAILIAFSTSSSAATLPVTMECCERNLGVPKTTTSFVLPLGATINMDGTSMYQAVATVFIAQVYGLDLHFSDQLTILLTATLASIGTAPVPGVGIVMLIIVLRSVHIPEEGIALILGVDRILDMCRTTVNITGDAVVATVVAKMEGTLRSVKR